MLKRYKQFIKEELTSQELDVLRSELKSINDKRDDWKDEIMNVSLDEKLGTSYSTLCKRNDDPKQDYNNFQKFMDKKGFTFDVIEEIFSEKSDEIVGRDIFEEIRLSPLDNQNGYVDTYLYFTIERLRLDTDKIELGGGGWSTYFIGNGEEAREEAVIRYSYGYHKTKYGHLMMKQAGLTRIEFIKMAMKDLSDVIKDDFYNDVILQWCKGNGLKKFVADRISEDFEISDFSITENDRMILETRKIAEHLNQGLEYNFEKDRITHDDICSYTIKLLSKMDYDDFDKTDREFIIYGEFNGDI
jgi:hypothetical protein